MTSKVQPAENHWTDDVKMASKVQPAADYWTVDQEKGGTRLCYFVERKNKERNGETPSRKRKYFEWIIKQLLNSASEGVIHLGPQPLWITPSLICRILHILLIAKSFDSLLAESHWKIWQPVSNGLICSGSKAFETFRVFRERDKRSYKTSHPSSRMLTTCCERSPHKWIICIFLCCESNKLALVSVTPRISRGYFHSRSIHVISWQTKWTRDYSQSTCRGGVEEKREDKKNKTIFILALHGTCLVRSRSLQQTLSHTSALERSTIW